MSVGQRIKERRRELELSVDDIAIKLNKNRATVYRYESNDIENLPITILEPLAKILQTTPAYLLGWGETKAKPRNSQDYFLEQYLRTLSYEITGDPSEGYIILETPDGEFEITEDDITEIKNSAESFIKFKISELINKSRKFPKKSYLEPVAAHDTDGNFSNEDIKHDIDIMNDDDVWNK